MECGVQKGVAIPVTPKCREAEAKTDYFVAGILRNPVSGLEDIFYQGQVIHGSRTAKGRSSYEPSKRHLERGYREMTVHDGGAVLPALSGCERRILRWYSRIFWIFDVSRRG